MPCLGHYSGPLVTTCQVKVFHGHKVKKGRTAPVGLQVLQYIFTYRSYFRRARCDVFFFSTQIGNNENRNMKMRRYQIKGDSVNIEQTHYVTKHVVFVTRGLNESYLYYLRVFSLFLLLSGPWIASAASVAGLAEMVGVSILATHSPGPLPVPAAVSHLCNAVLGALPVSVSRSTDQPGMAGAKADPPPGWSRRRQLYEIFRQTAYRVFRFTAANVAKMVHMNTGEIDGAIDASELHLNPIRHLVYPDTSLPANHNPNHRLVTAPRIHRYR